MNKQDYTSNEFIWEGFWYTVYRDGNRVVKLPRNENTRILASEIAGLEAHETHMWDFIPNTTFTETDEWYNVSQEFIAWEAVDLMETTNNKVFELLESWATMQEKEWILFDVFWLEWMVRLFNYYYGDTLLGKTNNFLLPLSWRFLQILHNFPYETIKQLNKDTSSPFISENILENSSWNVKFVDIEHRSLQKPKSIKELKKYPLNLLWAWITKKALKDLMKNRNTN